MLVMPATVDEKRDVEQRLGTRKVIHVHQQKVRAGVPACIVRTYKGSSHYREVRIDGPSTMVHSLEPDRCGARLWIETDSPVFGIS